MKRILIGLMIVSFLFAATTAFAGGKQEAQGEAGEAMAAAAPTGNEAPELTDMVAAGELPPLADRLPAEPLVIPVKESIGQYGGRWHRLWLGPSDSPGPSRITTERLVYWDEEGQVDRKSVV